MRSAPAGQITTRDTGFFSVHSRVQVKNGSGTWINLTTVSSGKNWLLGVEYDDDIDYPVAQLTVELAREYGALSLAPLDETSALNRLDDGTTYSPLLDVAREIKWEACTLAPGATPAGGDWTLFFHGYIDRIEWPRTQSVVRLVCRDLGAKLVDTFIETKREYGSVAGVAVETVMQSILTDNSTGVTLYTPTSPSFVVSPSYWQEHASVMEAIKTLAMMTGWDVRYKWDSGTSSFRLTFFQPDRAKTTPDKTLGPSAYIDVQQLDLSIEGIRNAIAVKYLNATTGLQSDVTVTDATSISRYGRRFMMIEEASDSPINTSTEATAFVNAALSDLKDPKSTNEIELLFFWQAELGDLFRFSSNGIHWDTNQDRAVVGIRHRVYLSEHRTWLRVRGRPAGAYEYWLGRDRRIQETDKYSSTAPMLQIRKELSANLDTADVYVKGTTKTGEYFRVHLKDSEAAGAATWSLVTGAADSTPRFVASATEIGPSDYFHNGSTFAQKLNDIALTRDQVTRIFIQAEGKESKIRTDWIPYEVDLKGTPWLESLECTWDEVNDYLRYQVRGGARTQSVKIEADDDPVFGSPIATVHQVNVADGAVYSSWFTISEMGGVSARDKPWYVRATPYNAATSGGVVQGLAGQPQQAAVRVEGNVFKSARISSHAWGTAEAGGLGTVYDFTNGYLKVIQGNTVTYFDAPLELPDGVDITGFEARLYRADSVVDVATIALYEQTDSGITQIGSTGTHSGTGWSNVSVSVSATSTTGKQFLLRATLYSTTTSPPDIRLAWGKLSYTMPTLSNTR